MYIAPIHSKQIQWKIGVHVFLNFTKLVYQIELVNKIVAPFFGMNDFLVSIVFGAFDRSFDNVKHLAM